MGTENIGANIIILGPNKRDTNALEMAIDSFNGGHNVLGHVTAANEVYSIFQIDEPVVALVSYSKNEGKTKASIMALLERFPGASVIGVDLMSDEASVVGGLVEKNIVLVSNDNNRYDELKRELLEIQNRK